ncbi:MAG: chitobiase/beta-hexosaminidase C-terminal domain-containing protein, partial [Muribaculaceae bacterium]|nr:chitobiase/beta-hexosaminidase C-terminal domain-containing protein [Muribaculaceae bacterium]
VLMNAPYPDAEIRYTTDGSEPDAGSTLYTGAFTTDSREIRACTVMPAYGKQSLTSILYIP